jgi:polyisoprenoid-binding protein YceI
MKKLPSAKKYSLLLLSACFILSCKHPAEKNIGSQKPVTTTATKKEVTATDSHPKKDVPEKKEKSAPAAESRVAKWEANAATSKIGFSVKGPFGTVNGNLSGLKSSILFEKDNLAASSINASTNTSSISTGIKLRNKDLQKSKYLDAEKHPTISFKSDKIEKSGDGYKAIGELTIKGISKHQEIPFSFSEKGNEGVFQGKFTIQRESFGVGTPGGSIGDIVTVNLTVPVTKATAKKQ